MTIYAAPGSTFEAVLSGAPSGQVGTMGVRISNLVTDTDFFARTTVSVVEYPATSGIYSRSLVAPTDATSPTAAYAVIWDNGTTFTQEELVVTSSALIAAVPAPGDLTALATVRQALTISTTADDALIQTLITAASKTLQKRYEREWADMGTLTRRFRVRSSYVQLTPYDLRAATSLTLHPESTSPITLIEFQDYMLEQASSEGTVWDLDLACGFSFGSTTRSRFGYALLDIAGTWGCTSVPADVNRACVATVSSWLDRGADQIAGFDSDVREQISGMVASWAIPAAAHRLCRPYARPVV